VANIGKNFGAVIPESAELEIIESKHTSETSGVYKSMADWVDKQVSKFVLGQTMTADDGASLAQIKTYEEVQQDIADSDIMQAVDALNAALVVPYVALNFGEQEEYPKLDLFKPDEKNIEQIIQAVEKLGPQRLKVKADELRSLLGLENPKADDEVVDGRSTSAPMGEEPPPETEPNAARISLNAEIADADELDAFIDGESYAAVSDDIAEVIEKAADASSDFESFQEELKKLVKNWSPDEIAELTAVAFFKAWVLGAAEFDKGE
jgi:phage gp29-like protein